jgi:hypothetical protein
MVLGLENLESADSIQGTKNGKPLNIREGLAPAFESRPSLIQPVDCIAVPRNKRLFLNFNDADTTAKEIWANGREP